MKPAHKKGFTLVELLVVITIIAVLSTIGLVVYSGVQKNARMAKRISDLKAIQTALELYYSVNKKYPVTAGAGVYNTECGDWNGGGKTPENVILGLVPTYMPAFPADPQMKKATPSNSCYIYRSDNGTDYKIIDWNVSEMITTDYQSQPNLIDPRRDGGGDANCSTVQTTNIYAWAISSSNTGVNNINTNPACW